MECRDAPSPGKEGRARTIARRIGWRVLALPGLSRLLGPALEPLLRRREQERWEAAWASERSGAPELLADFVPSQLEEAVATGWIPPGSRSIDIGSGRGQVSAWLAERGFPVVAADASEEASLLARRHFAHLAPLLEFRTQDASIPAEEFVSRFDFLFDRGCYHVLPPTLLPGYLSNVAAWARPGARFLLFSRRGPDAVVPRLFDPAFEIVDSEPIVYVRSAGPHPRAEAPGTAFRMLRRG
jgi:SAM-dependent methyltransferase